MIVSPEVLLSEAICTFLYIYDVFVSFLNGALRDTSVEYFGGRVM
jgi:hypothetical protein